MPPDPDDEHKSASLLVARAMDFCATDGAFHSDMDGFLRDHAREFVSAVDAPADLEHELRWTELYREYLALFERHLEGFVEAQGASPEQFYAACRAALASTDDERALFVERVLASEGYDGFFEMMLTEARGFREVGTRPLS